MSCCSHSQSIPPCTPHVLTSWRCHCYCPRAAKQSFHTLPLLPTGLVCFPCSAMLLLKFLTFPHKDGLLLSSLEVLLRNTKPIPSLLAASQETLPTSWRSWILLSWWRVSRSWRQFVVTGAQGTTSLDRIPTTSLPCHSKYGQRGVPTPQTSQRCANTASGPRFLTRAWLGRLWKHRGSRTNSKPPWRGHPQPQFLPTKVLWPSSRSQWHFLLVDPLEVCLISADVRRASLQLVKHKYLWHQETPCLLSQGIQLSFLQLAGKSALTFCLPYTAPILWQEQKK